MPGMRLFSFEPAKLDDIETRAFEGGSLSETDMVRSVGCASVRKADVAKLVDAPDLGSGGKPWGFESLHPHHENPLFFHVTY